MKTNTAFLNNSETFTDDHFTGKNDWNNKLILKKYCISH